MMQIFRFLPALFFTLAVTLSGIAAAATDKSSNESGTKIVAGGDYVFHLEHDRLNRMYRVHIPKGYDRSKPAPVLLAYHGGGGDMDYMARDGFYGLISKSDREGFIAVFPNGYSKLRSGRFATWNAGACCGDARDKKIDDVGFTRKLVGDLEQKVALDRKRIYAVGMSNGGMMAYRLACDAADLVKAVASIAGTDNTLSCQPSRPVPVLHIHAKDDTHVLFNGGAGKGSFKDLSKVTDFTSVPATVDRWRTHDRCTVNTPRRVLAIKGAYCDLYPECADGAQVKLCVTEAGGHSWPGGYKPRAAEPPSHAISANDQFWSFFESLE